MRIAGFIIALAMAALAQGAPSVAQTAPMTLQPYRLPGMCLTLAGADGASVSMPCNGSDTQDFILPGPEGGPIRQGDTCLAPRGEGYYPQLHAEACDGSPAQTWTMDEEGALRSAADRCLSLLGGGASRTGELIYGGECPKLADAQTWRAKSVGATNVVEASLESAVRPSMCIGHDSHLGLYPCSDGYGQIISFDESALGQMRMKSSCFSGGFAFGGLSLAECWDLPAQRWVKLPDGSFGNELAECIEVVNEGGRDVLRTTVCGGKPEQQWIVRRKPTE